MKKLFPEYYKPSETEFQELWGNCLFSVDASVLLNIYGYSEATREQFLPILERLAPRIRMPHQFALEYQRNRIKAIMEQVRNYQKAEKVLQDLYSIEFLPKTKHPFLSDEMMQSFKRIQEHLEDGRKRHEALLKTDPYFDRISAMLENVGSQPGDYEELYKKGKVRYASKIPPGYADAKDKVEPEMYGDFVGWIQIMDFSKAEKKPIIFLTDDSKEDWWQIQSERNIGPRPELIAEFMSSCGQKFYMYSSDRFMEFANVYLKEQIEPQAIEEVKERLKEQLKNKSEMKAVSVQPIAEAPKERAVYPADQPKQASAKADGAEIAMAAKPEKATA